MSNMHTSDSTTSSPIPQVVELTSMGIIQVSGEDATDFLHNLLTNDIKNMSPEEALLCGFCNPKGRLFAIITVIKREQDFLLLLPKELADFIQQRLSMFILRSKVSLRRLDKELSIIALLATHTDAVTEVSGPVQCTLATFPAIKACLLGIANQSSATELFNNLKSHGWQIVMEDQWQAKLIQAGIAQIFNASKEAFTPQQVNLDLVGGVSFKKGCYPGQEVIARLHYLGSPSRRLFTAQMTIEELPQPDTDVVDESGEIMGQVVQAVFMVPNLALLQLSMKLSMTDKTGFISNQALTELTACVDEP